MKFSSDDHSFCNLNPRFMQPILPDFLHSFSVPKAFLKHLELDLKGHPLQSVVLMTENQPQCSWHVTVEGGRHFKDGWEEFCVHHNLQIGDFVVFVYQSDLHFQVIVYDPRTACEREFPPSDDLITVPKNREPERIKAGGGTEIPSEPVQSATCQVTLSTYYIKKAIIFLPAKFVRVHGLLHRRGEVLIIDEKERPWRVVMNYKKCDNKTYIKTGWKGVLIANCFKPGDVVSFTFLKGGKRPTLKCHKIAVDRRKFVHKVTRRTAPPSFRVCLSKYAVKSSVIYLPKYFARENGLYQRRCEVKVIDEKRRSWEVTVNFKKSNNDVYIGRGWKQVQVANCFYPGDNLCFELLEASELPILKCFRLERARDKLKSACKTRANKAQVEDVTTIPFREGPSKYPSFHCRISSYALRASVIYLPRPFVRENGLMNRRCDAKVIDEKGRTWEVGMFSKTYAKYVTYICRGWRDIQVANCFEIGDSLCFELLEASEIPIFKCSKLKGTKDSLKFACKTTISKAQTKDVTKFPSGDTASKYPRFHFHLSPYAIRKNIIFLPRPFVKQNDLMNRKCEVKVIDEKRRTWYVWMNFKKYEKNATYFCQGWKGIQVANCFKPGDNLCFELLEASELPIFKCFKLKGTKDNSKSVCKTRVKKAQSEEIITIPSRFTAIKHPSFHFYLSPYAIRTSIISLPMPFSRQHDLIKRRCEVKVIDEKGKTWVANMSYTKSANERVFICGGWKQIQVANCFKTGDTLCFELLEAGKQPIFKCHRVSRKGEATKDGIRVLRQRRRS